MKIRVVVNPASAAGRTQSKIPELRRLLATHGMRNELLETTRPGDATQHAREAVRDGVDLIVGVGGDGTFGELVQGFLDSCGRPVCGPSVAFIASGTGGDLRRSLGLPDSLEQAVAAILAGPSATLDLGRVTFHTQGKLRHHAFINVASLGVSAAVSQRVNASPKWLSGTLCYYAATVQATIGYRNIPLRITADGTELHSGPVYVAAFANGEYFGGGMRIAPGAVPNDGLLNAVVLTDFGLTEVLALSRKIYSGRHLHHPKVRHQVGTHFEVTPLAAELGRRTADLDGEVPTVSLPLTIELLPRALSVRGALLG